MDGGHLKWNTERLVEEIVNVIPDEILKGLADLWNLTPLDGVLKV